MRPGPFQRQRPGTGGFRGTGSTPRHGLARVLSKAGVCSRAEATRLIAAGAVTVNGTVCRDPERPTDPRRDRLIVRGEPVRTDRPRVYLLLNKPRGLVTTASDERGRATVYECLAGQPDLPRVVPVGRLDQASEGLLLFTNDTAWAAFLTDPASGVAKTYHVQIDAVADDTFCGRIVAGAAEGGEWLAAESARVLRAGEKNSWLEIVLREGKNRHLRRLLAALGHEVLRLVRVRLGSLELGDLPKGAVRRLTPEEVRRLGPGRTP